VTKQLGLEQRFGQSSTIELDEGTIPAGRQVMNTGRYEFFAGAALTNDQHWPVQLGDAGNTLQHFQKNR